MARDFSTDIVSEVDTRPIYVRPYARVVPNGIVRSRGRRFLRATVLLTPEISGESGEVSTGYTLQSWPKHVFEKLAESDFKFPLAIFGIDPGNVPIDIGKCGAPCQVEADAWRADSVFGARDLDDLRRIWLRSLFEGNETEWLELAKRIDASLGSTAVNPTALDQSTAPTAPLSEDQQSAKDGRLYGNDGQLKLKIEPNAERALHAMAAVPHSDLAVSIEFQRVEELLISYAEAEMGGDVRCAAELARLECLAETLTEEHLPPTDSVISEEDVKTKRKEAAIARHKALREKVVSASETVTKTLKSAADATATQKCVRSARPTGIGAPKAFVAGEEAQSTFERAEEIASYASWSEYADTAPGEAPKRVHNETNPVLAAAERAFFTLQSSPALARLFGLAIDVRINLDEIEGTSPPVNDGFVLVSCPDPSCGDEERSVRALPLTLAKLDRARRWFYPASETEWECAEESPERDGHFRMGAPLDPAAPDRLRYDLTSLDIRTATELECQRRQIRRANMLAVPAADRLDYEGVKSPKIWAKAGLWEDLCEASSLQTSGLALLDRGVLQQSTLNLAASIAKSEESFPEGTDLAKLAGASIKSDLAVCGFQKQLVLDAADLTVGSRLDVGVPVKKGDDSSEVATEWRSLTGRVVDYGTSGEFSARRFVDQKLPRIAGSFKSDERVKLDSAMQTVPARLIATDKVDGENKQPVDVVMEEAIAQWNGDPMGADSASRPGRVSEAGLRFGRTISLPNSDDFDDHLLPPPLRYGCAYRFKMRQVFSGGGAVPVDALADDQLDTPYPPGRNDLKDDDAAQPYFRFLRQSRLDVPTVLMLRDDAKKLNLPMGPEHSLNMLVRSVDLTRDERKVPELRALASRAKPRAARRILLPPQVSFEEATRHGVFDRLQSSRRPQGLIPRAAKTDEGGFPTVGSAIMRGFNGEAYLANRRYPYDPNDEGSDGAGDAVLDVTGADANGRYYPDPMASKLVFALRHPAEGTYVGEPVFVSVEPATLYPRMLPVVVDLLQATTPASGQAHIRLRLAGRKVRVETGGFNSLLSRIIVSLPPGEDYELDCWAVPSADDLCRNFSLIQSLAIYANRIVGDATGEDCLAEAGTKLGAACNSEVLAEALASLACGASAADPGTSFFGPGGETTPPKQALQALAEKLYQMMLKRPLPELASVRSVRVTHAINRPIRIPSVPSTPAEGDGPRFEEKVAPIETAEMRILRPERNRLENDTELTGGDAIDHLATEFALDGQISFRLDQVDGFELIGQAILPGASAFDDPKRGRSVPKKRDGDWPKFALDDGRVLYRTGKDIFGFAINETGVTKHDEVTFPLLRVESLSREIKKTFGGDATLPLRPFFLSDSETTDEWRVVRKHVFPDDKARKLRVKPRVFGRTAAFLDTANYVRGGIFRTSESLPQAVTYKDGDWTEVILPATKRPAKCNAPTPEPVFAWHGRIEERGKNKGLLQSRRIVTRIRLSREWFSSGEDEQLGIVLWPPNLDETNPAPFCDDGVPIPDPTTGALGPKADLPQFIDDDLGPGGRFVSRMGLDPIAGQDDEQLLQGLACEVPLEKFGVEFRAGQVRRANRPGLFIGPDTFHRDLGREEGDPRKATYVANAQMPTVEQARDVGALVPGKSLTVGLICYRPLFDPETEEWYVDVDLDIGVLSEAMVRFGLVRYQPHTKADLRVSEPVTQWAHVMASRHLTVTQNEFGGLTLSLFGAAALSRKSAFDPSEDQGEEIREAYRSVLDGKEEGAADALFAHEKLHDRPRLHYEVFREREGPGGILLRTPVRLDQPDTDPLGRPNAGCLVPKDSPVGWISLWTWELNLLETPAPGETFVLYVEERPWFRPASYPIEPAPTGAALSPDTDIFRPAGARYAARLDLGRLLGGVSKDVNCETVVDE